MNEVPTFSKQISENQCSYNCIPIWLWRHKPAFISNFWAPYSIESYRKIISKIKDEKNKQEGVSQIQIGNCDANFTPVWLWFHCALEPDNHFHV